MVSSNDKSGNATENTEEPQLAELLHQEAAKISNIELKVTRTQLIDYTYEFKGKQVSTQKVQVILQSKIASQYCLGVAKLQKNDKAELKKIQDRWQTDTTWKFKTIKILNEKPAFIHTPCRIVVDLRKSMSEQTLQSNVFPDAPEPTATIADVLQLKQMQRFDLMAIPTEIIDERTSGTGMRIADVRLVDGTKQTQSNTTEQAYASLPLTLFFKNETELSSFKSNIGQTPLLFMSLSCNCKNAQIEVVAIKDHTWVQPAAGTKCASMAAQAATICDRHTPTADVASLGTFQAQESIDYTSPMATLTACRLMDPTLASATSMLGDATEHLYQLNHVYVIPPSKTDTIKTNDETRLFAQLDVWDYSKKITLAFRSKAMLQLATLADDQAQEYEKLLQNDELRHPLLASLRVQVQLKKKPEVQNSLAEPSQTQEETTLSHVVVEAMPCTFIDIPNDSLEAIHGLLAGCPPTTERLVAMPLHKLKPSPFYNMLANGEPIDKALTLLRFTQRGNGKQLSQGFRIITDRVRDAIDHDSVPDEYATVTLCTVEKVTDFSTAKDATAIAIICKVVAASKPEQHAADLYIEAMEVVPTTQVDACVQMMLQLYRVANTQSKDATMCSESAWQQRKCRKLCRSPTLP